MAALTQQMPTALPGRRYGSSVSPPAPPAPPIPWFATPGSVGQVLRAPGRLVINPTEEFATGEYPYGGTPLGSLRACVVQAIGDAYVVEYESFGGAGDVLEAPQRYVFSCFVRGWDDVAIAAMMAGHYEEGAYTQHAVFKAPGATSRTAGTSALARALTMLYVPDDTINVPAILMYRTVPHWSQRPELDVDRDKELGLPIVFECVRDDDGRILAMGRIEDLEL